MRLLLIAFVGLALVATTGCGKMGGMQSKSAIKAAVEAHLKQRSNLQVSNMTFEVGDVKFSGDRAEAEVIYQSKQSPDLTVRISYILRKAGDHWEVESSSPMGGMGGTPHGAMNPTPPNSQPTAPGPQPSH
jgi:ketosteroid isomerase-like protein